MVSAIAILATWGTQSAPVIVARNGVGEFGGSRIELLGIAAVDRKKQIAWSYKGVPRGSDLISAFRAFDEGRELWHGVSVGQHAKEVALLVRVTTARTFRLSMPEVEGGEWTEGSGGPATQVGEHYVSRLRTIIGCDATQKTIDASWLIVGERTRTWATWKDGDFRDVAGFHVKLEKSKAKMASWDDEKELEVAIDVYDFEISGPFDGSSSEWELSLDRKGFPDFSGGGEMVGTSQFGEPGEPRRFRVTVKADSPLARVFVLKSQPQAKVVFKGIPLAPATPGLPQR